MDNATSLMAIAATATAAAMANATSTATTTATSTATSSPAAAPGRVFQVMVRAGTIFSLPLFVTIRTLGLGLWFLCIFLKGLRLLFLFRFSESKAAWRRSLSNGTLGLLPSTASSSSLRAGLSSLPDPADDPSAIPLSVVESKARRGPRAYPPSTIASHLGAAPPPRMSTSKDAPADMVAIDLASGRLHLPAGALRTDTDPTDPVAPSYSSWWFENRETVADARLSRLVLLVAAMLMAYCVALAFVPGVGLFPQVAYAPFGPGGENFNEVSNGVGGVRGGLVGEGNCGQFSWPFYPLLGIEAGFGFVGFPALLWLLRRVEDNHGIRIDILIAVLFSIVALLAHLALTLSRSFSLLVNNYFIVNLVIYITFLTSLIIPVYRSFAEQRARDRSLAMGLSLAAFRKVLDDPALVKDFKHFCVKDFSVENIMFYEEVRHLKQKLVAHLANPDLGVASTTGNPGFLVSSSASTTTSSSDPAKPTDGASVSSSKKLWKRKPRPEAVAAAAATDDPRPSVDTFAASDVTPLADGFPRPSLSLSETSTLPRTAAQPPVPPPPPTTTAPAPGPDLVPPALRQSYRLVYLAFIQPARAPLEVNLPADVRDEVTRAFETETVAGDVFDRAVGFVEETMFWNSFGKWWNARAGRAGRR
ncbi:hypothetical protein HDU96_007594 [Phlyctochytrium bullatum]|nr:hypothetical protein HDU96_007594 [Phlyctochytrium bullatum]